MGMERKLAAIFALDMVSFSRLMEADEAGTLKRHRSHITELLEPSVEAHHGHVVKGTGDGLLCEFASAVDAVECAVEIQRAMPAREEGIPTDRRIEYRIGINVGDIVVEGGDIYGDGVNAAARIEALTDPGGVFISGSAFNQVKNKVQLGFEDLGLHTVKNIEEPVHVYRVLLDPEAAGELPGQGRYRHPVRELFKRRVPQITGVYLGVSWAFLEFVDWAVSQYGLSPTVSSFVVSILLLFLPSVVWIAWRHGAPGRDRWGLTDGLIISANLAVAAGVLFIVSGFTVSELTTLDPVGDAARATRVSALESLADTEDPRRIAVLYFEPRSTQEEVPYLAAGLTEALIRELGTVPALHVTSRNGSAIFRGLAVQPDSIGRALKVGTLVDGTVAVSDDRIRVNVTFLDASTGDQFGRTLVERPRAELFELQEDLAHEVAVFLRGVLGEEIELIERRSGADNVEAWEWVQRARAASDQADALSDAGNPSAAWSALGDADSLLVLAEESAPEWVDPTVMRGWLAYQRSRWAGSMDQMQADLWIDEGLNHAAIALQLEPGNPDALELRGTLQYWKWLLDLEPDPVAADRLFEKAETDLRQAIAMDQEQAGAWAVLSHLLLNKAETAEAKMAASRAYQADAYLRSADAILWRLYTTSYDLEDQIDAAHWCAELGRRFPGEPRFAECQLWHMTMHDAEANVDRARELADELISLRPVQEAEFSQRWAGMALAAVLARENMADSARAVAYRSRGNASVDPTRDLVYVEAFVRTLLGEFDEATDLLAEYMAAVGGDPSDIDYWWFDDLRNEPRYQALLASGGG
jgi:class 3 adenylate cyclase/TolB-like protein